MNLATQLKSDIAQEYSVSQISALIKRKIEENFSFIKVRGEVSGLKIATSGHVYFNLKDQDSVLACTCWKPIAMRIPFKMEDGMEVIVTGRLSAFAGQSKYNLNAERIEAAGSGALMEILQKRKALLAQEGLFDEARKKPIPMFPRKIGVITSAVGAVIQDILHRVKDRCPATIQLWAVAVQGESCAFEVTTAINGFNKMDAEDRPDVIIVARGGGSIEDLWGFNEEIVVRAAANSTIPIISAIGHETDITLIDFASDKRAPTPTAAAEFATPLISTLRDRIDELIKRSHRIITHNIEAVKIKFSLAYTSLSRSEKFLYPKYQKLDDLSFRLSNSLPNNLNIKIVKMSSINLPHTAIEHLIQRKNLEYQNLFEKSSKIMQSHIKTLYAKFELNASLIESMNISKILSRGFAIVRSSDGNILPRKASALKYDNFTIEWVDGTIKLHRSQDEQ